MSAAGTKAEYRQRKNSHNSESPESESKIMITVRLFATFRENRFKEKEMEFGGEEPISDLLNRIRISADEVGILLINGNSATPETKLRDGDTVSIFPAIGGG